MLEYLVNRNVELVADALCSSARDLVVGEVCRFERLVDGLAEVERIDVGVVSFALIDSDIGALRWRVWIEAGWRYGLDGS